MSRRKQFEELAMTRTSRRAARIRELIQDIGYDWFDSDISGISNEADSLSASLDEFDRAVRELFSDWRQRSADEARQ